MEKFDTYMINKIFTVPYFDRMISENVVPQSFLKCVKDQGFNDRRRCDNDTC